MLKHKLVDFIIQFMEEVDKEISEMKLFVCPPPLPPPPSGFRGMARSNISSTAECAGAFCG